MSGRRNAWRSSVRSATHTASHLPGGGMEVGALMWMILLHLHVNKKQHDDDDDVQ